MVVEVQAREARMYEICRSSNKPKHEQRVQTGVSRSGLQIWVSWCRRRGLSGVVWSEWTWVCTWERDKRKPQHWAGRRSNFQRLKGWLHHFVELRFWSRFKYILKPFFRLDGSSQPTSNDFLHSPPESYRKYTQLQVPAEPAKDLIVHQIKNIKGPGQSQNSRTFDAHFEKDQ